MRQDYALYAVAIICFIIAIYSASLADTQLYLYALAVLGIIFIGLGYMVRPKETALKPSTSIPAPPEPTPKQETKPEKEPKKTRKKRTTRRRKKKT